MTTAGAAAVLALSAVMFGVSFCAGTVPLAIPWNQEKMAIISSLGVGLLVGTSLGVVLPEGIETMYASAQPSETHAGHDLTQIAENALVSRQAAIDASQKSSDDSYHFAIALALVSGYLLMHLLTFLPPLVLEKSPESPIPLSVVPSSPRHERHSSGGPLDTPTRFSNVTLGLSIHAMADGIALGSSAVSDNLAIEGIVFLAIMLHKAPASFSLTAILLRESYPRHSIKRQLLLFALSSPLSTIITYLMLSSISLGQYNISFWSGVFLLFSAGTLIFASTNAHLHIPEERVEKETVKRGALRELVAGTIGMCVPLVLGIMGHGH